MKQVIYNKQLRNLTLILISISLISFVSAITIYSGESIVIELEKPFEYYSIVGNSSPVILDMIQDGTTLTITPNKYSQEDSYEIIFFDREKEIITVYQSSGSGGTRTIYEDKEVIKYVDRDVVEYVDKEIEVQGESIEVEKIVREGSWGWFFIAMLLLCIVLYFVFFKKEKIIIERGLEKNE